MDPRTAFQNLSRDVGVDERDSDAVNDGRLLRAASRQEDAVARAGQLDCEGDRRASVDDAPELFLFAPAKLLESTADVIDNRAWILVIGVVAGHDSQICTAGNRGGHAGAIASVAPSGLTKEHDQPSPDVGA